jgi:hypothetical protein
VKYNDAIMGKTVLAVDDSPAFIDALSGPFEDAGYRVATAVVANALAA